MVCGWSVTSLRGVAEFSLAGLPIWWTGFAVCRDTPGYPYRVQVTLEMLVKSIVVKTLPAVPWPTPSFTWRERVGQGPGPAGAGEAGELAGAAGADDAGALLAGGAEEALPPAVVLEELPHPAASTAAQVSTTAGSARRARSRVVSITVPSERSAP